MMINNKKLNASTCSYRLVLEVIANKWTALVFYALEDEKKRYSDLKKQITGISQKMLTETLRKMERDGLVKREVYPSVPATVDYSLTPLGETLIEPMKILHKWTETNYDLVVQAREDYDQGNYNEGNA
ncbi:helix-turn-helix domain-containing protein [Bacillus sp. 03113]|uniref:winged helix-turn-helix transcriptional regulator n=1 Tax=Bacillus sp. 03113 TaxID=2578211 RepID=UPI001143BA0C|nr:helix-turn-helix domain-containing protein [Bacillus sp. 03113]